MSWPSSVAGGMEKLWVRVCFLTRKTEPQQVQTSFIVPIDYYQCFGRRNRYIVHQTTPAIAAASFVPHHTQLFPKTNTGGCGRHQRGMKWFARPSGTKKRPQRRHATRHINNLAGPRRAPSSTAPLRGGTAATASSASSAKRENKPGRRSMSLREDSNNGNPGCAPLVAGRCTSLRDRRDDWGPPGYATPPAFDENALRATQPGRPDPAAGGRKLLRRQTSVDKDNAAPKAVWLDMSPHPSEPGVSRG